MKIFFLGLVLTTSISQAFASGIKCKDGYSYYKNASDRPTIIIHNKSGDNNDITVTGIGSYKITGQGKMFTEKNGTFTLIADNLNDLKGNTATLKVNINAGQSATVLKSVFGTIEKDFYCTNFSWSGSEFDN